MSISENLRHLGCHLSDSGLTIIGWNVINLVILALLVIKQLSGLGAVYPGAEAGIGLELW